MMKVVHSKINQPAGEKTKSDKSLERAAFVESLMRRIVATSNARVRRQKALATKNVTN